MAKQLLLTSILLPKFMFSTNYNKDFYVFEQSKQNERKSKVITISIAERTNTSNNASIHKFFTMSGNENAPVCSSSVMNQHKKNR